MKIITNKSGDYQIYFNGVADYKGGNLSIIIWKNGDSRNVKKNIRGKFGIQCALGGTIGMFNNKKNFEISLNDIPKEFYKFIIIAFFQFQRPDSKNRYEAIL